MAGIGHYWKDLIDYGKEVTFLTTLAKEFFNDLGIQPPLKILLGEKHTFVSDLATNAVRSSTSVQMRDIERDIVLNAEAVNDAIPIRALSIVAIGKLFGNSKALEQMSSACKNEVEKLQLKLGFAAEFLFLSQLFHNSVANVPEVSFDAGNTTSEQQHRENKIGTLVGDFLITKLFSVLAELECNQVTETMMLCLAHMAEHEFEIDSAEGSETKGGIEIIFSQSFRCAVYLSGHSKDVQDQAQQLGLHFGRSYKVFRDLRKLSSTMGNQCPKVKLMKKSLHAQIENIKQLVKRIPNYSINRGIFAALLDSMKLEFN